MVKVVGESVKNVTNGTHRKPSSENTPNNVEKEKIHLKREIGLMEACGITIGCIIGSGVHT